MMAAFSSDQVPAANRVRAYEAAMREYSSSIRTKFDLQIASAAPDTFAASLAFLSIGQLSGGLHRINTPHLLVAEAMIDDEPMLDLYCVFEGKLALSSDAGEFTLEGGDMALLPAEAPFRAWAEEIDMIALGIPKALICRRMPERALLIGHAFRGGGGVGACLATLLRTAAQQLNSFSPADGRLLQSMLLDCVLHRLEVECGDADRSLTIAQRDRLDDLQSIALDAIADPDLNPDMVARKAGLSTRTLHRLFQASGKSFADWLREARLDRCRFELSRPGQRRLNIASVAFEWGFNDLTTFNRAFREHYGMTPREVRGAAVNLC